jgi:hypothetical protein
MFKQWAKIHAFVKVGVLVKSKVFNRYIILLLF